MTLTCTIPASISRIPQEWYSPKVRSTYWSVFKIPFLPLFPSYSFTKRDERDKMQVLRMMKKSKHLRNPTRITFIRTYRITDNYSERLSLVLSYKKNNCGLSNNLYKFLISKVTMPLCKCNFVYFWKKFVLVTLYIHWM